MSGVSAGVAAVTKFSTKVISKVKGISKVSNNANNAKVVNKTVQIYQKNIQHIFRDAPGHLLDTPENKKLLVDITSDSKKFLGKDEFENDWHAKIIESGKQVWTSSRNGEIRNGGVNDIPKIFNTQTGLSSPTKP